MYRRGTQLSAGQRQLLAFARTLVANPTIFILDEATSSIDNESEKLISNATQSLMANRTSVVIARRLTTIHHATCIYLLSKGEIKRTGNP
ncbi:MAG: ATP-binding cassette domain-containing protein [Bacteroidetes bacterium]|nr:ATP-binding cassette domain-containing protein [Bacteroidota bacterium]